MTNSNQPKPAPQPTPRPEIKIIGESLDPSKKK